MSRRYLRMIEQWIPTGIAYFADWPDRPNCGHFFGGCHWYGIETISCAETFAYASTSPEYDEASTGVSRDTLREMAIKGVRYLCFTHDSGPEDCVRPQEGLGRSENCGTKWGELGKGFFRESQCGSTVAGLARVCLLLREWIDEETWMMVARVHEDYAATIRRHGTQKRRLYRHANGRKRLDLSRAHLLFPLPIRTRGRRSLGSNRPQMDVLHMRRAARRQRPGPRRERNRTLH